MRFFCLKPLCKKSISPVCITKKIKMKKEHHKMLSNTYKNYVICGHNGFEYGKSRRINLAEFFPFPLNRSEIREINRN